MCPRSHLILVPTKGFRRIHLLLERHLSAAKTNRKLDVPTTITHERGQISPLKPAKRLIKRPRRILQHRRPRDPKKSTVHVAAITQENTRRYPTPYGALTRLKVTKPEPRVTNETGMSGLATES